MSTTPFKEYPAWLDAQYVCKFYDKLGDDVVQALEHREHGGLAFRYRYAGAVCYFSLWSEVGQLVRPLYNLFWRKYQLIGTVEHDGIPYLSDRAVRRGRRLPRDTVVTDDIIYQA